jgi:hypothetical protein
MWKEVRVPLSNCAEKSGRLSECVISYRKVPDCSLKFENAEFGVYEISDEDLFECLCKLREFLEHQGCLILCNGARVDAYPSSMARQMSGGEKIYILTMGQPIGPGMSVNLFGTAQLHQVGSLAAQRAYYQQWCQSLSKE